MNIELSNKQKESQRQFKQFTTESIIPYASKHDDEERTSSKLIDSIAENGYLSSSIPKEFGGSEMDIITCGLLNEEIGRGCASLRSLLTVHNMTAIAILRWGIIDSVVNCLNCL